MTIREHLEDAVERAIVRFALSLAFRLMITAILSELQIGFGVINLQLRRYL